MRRPPEPISFLGAAVITLALLAGDRARAGVDYSGGNGRTIDAAVIVDGAATDSERAQAEKYWIDDHYDDVLFRGRVEQPFRGTTYDIVVFSAGGSRPQNLYFLVRGGG